MGFPSMPTIGIPFPKGWFKDHNQDGANTAQTANWRRLAPVHATRLVDRELCTKLRVESGSVMECGFMTDSDQRSGMPLIA